VEASFLASLSSGAAEPSPDWLRRRLSQGRACLVSRSAAWVRGMLANARPEVAVTSEVGREQTDNRHLPTRWGPLDIAFSVIAAGLLGHALYVLAIGIGQPISDLHAFRQAQTADSAYWLWRGGPWLAYETPVLGAPWSVPLELPVFQWLVAILRSFGIPIVLGGRLVSFSFFLAVLWPARVLFQRFRLGRTAYLTTTVLMLASPLYLFWSRTVMIESCALFLSVAWLASFSSLIVRPGLGLLVLTVVVGVVAVNTKITTFVPFGMLGVGLIVHSLLESRRKASPHSTERVAGLALVGGGIPFISAVAWNFYAETLRKRNPLGRELSLGLYGWNFGTWEQRVSGDLWWHLLNRRVLPQALGSVAVLALALIGVGLVMKNFRRPAVIMIAGFITPLLIFTNLHIVHDYYQYANALFLIVAVGLGVASLAEAGLARAALLALVVLVGGELAVYYRMYAPLVTADYSHTRGVLIASLVRQVATADESILVIGDEWSSEIPFYSERRALALPAWTSSRTVSRVLESPQQMLGSAKLGAVVYCPGSLASYGANADPIHRFVSHRKEVGYVLGCVVLRPDADP